ncbi:glycosyltransferase [Shewanella putrefaciens]|uniref:glycosyltransferase family 4 protein n=1 Tax=Shewanella putrefaciens TaxID=24 RepID=UPI003D7A0C7A
MKKAFVTIFPPFEEVHLYKDVGMIPRYMASEHGYQSYILSNNSCVMDEELFHSVECKLINESNDKINCVTSSSYNIFEMLIFLRNISTKYDKVVVNLYHFHPKHIILSFLIKVLFSNVFTYIKLDITSEGAKQLFNNSKVYKKHIRDFLLGFVDVFSAETMQAFSYLKQKANISDKTYLIPNGVFLNKESMGLNKIGLLSKKEKFIFSAGRLESYPKNTKLMVDSFLKSELWKDGWQLILAGSYDQELQKYINEQTKIKLSKYDEAIFLVGHLNRDELYSYMRRAKVFSLSSRWEGFALVLPEAVAHGCIIAATDVGGVADVTNMGALGFIAKEQTVDSFTDVLKSAAASDPSLGKKQMDFGISNFDWKTICDKLDKVLNEKTK